MHPPTPNPGPTPLQPIHEQPELFPKETLFRVKLHMTQAIQRKQPSFAGAPSQLDATSDTPSAKRDFLRRTQGKGSEVSHCGTIPARQATYEPVMSEFEGAESVSVTEVLVDWMNQKEVLGVMLEVSLLGLCTGYFYHW